VPADNAVECGPEFGGLTVFLPSIAFIFLNLATYFLYLILFRQQKGDIGLQHFRDGVCLSMHLIRAYILEREMAIATAAVYWVNAL